MKIVVWLLVAALLSLSLMASAEPVVEWSISEEDILTSQDYAYSIANDEVTIHRYTGSAASVVIPEKIDGCPVTAIYDRAFFQDKPDDSILTSISIPGSVRRIGSWAFNGCARVNALSLPVALESIGERAFQGCENLTVLSIPPSATYIGPAAFYRTNIKHIEVDPGNKTYAALDGNLYNKQLKELHTWFPARRDTRADIPGGIMSIGSNAFLGCDSLLAISLPDTLTTIGSRAFASCNALTSIAIPDAVEIISEYAFAMCRNLHTVDWPGALTIIGDGAFMECDSLSIVTLPMNTSTVGNYAFSMCDNLESIYITNKVSHIGYSAIESPTHVEVDPENPFYVVQDGALIDRRKNMLHTYLDHENTSHYDVPTEIVCINKYAFRRCALKSIAIPDSVKFIEQYTFAFSDITSVSLPDGLVTIDENAFYYCSDLASINIPDSVVGIGESAFQKCSSLRRIDIPSAIMVIGPNAFQGCDLLSIWADEGSYAIEYARSNGIPYTIQPDWLY